MPTSVSELVIVACVERYQRSCVDADPPPAPVLLTVADSVNDPPVNRPVSDTIGVPTWRSGGGAPTTTFTDAEQLSVVSDSSAIASTHAP